MAIKPRTWTVYIMQGDDLARLDELSQVERVARSRWEEQGRRGGESELAAASQARKEFAAEAATRAIAVEGRALGGKQWRELLANHPPRPKMRKVGGEETEVVHEEDAAFGVNVTTFPHALLTYVSADRPEMRTILEVSDPDLSTSDLSWLDDIAGGEYERLWTTAYGYNAGSGGDPKELAS